MTTIHRFFKWVKGFWLFWWVQKETHEPEPVNYGDRPPVGYDGNDPFNWYT